MTEIESNVPRAYVEEVGKQSCTEPLRPVRNTADDASDTRNYWSTGLVDGFEFSIDGVSYFLTYVPPSSCVCSCPGFSCQLQVDVRLKISPDEVSGIICKEPVGAIIKLKNGCKSQLEDWSTQLELLADEARESIRREGVVCETWFSFSLKNSTYLFAYMKQHHFSLRFDERRLPLSVDEIHKNFKTTWDASVRIPCVFTDARHLD